MLRNVGLKAGVDEERVDRMASGMQGVLQIWQSVVDRMVRFTTKSKLSMGESVGM